MLRTGTILAIDMTRAMPFSLNKRKEIIKPYTDLGILRVSNEEPTSSALFRKNIIDTREQTQEFQKLLIIPINFIHNTSPLHRIGRELSHNLITDVN